MFNLPSCMVAGHDVRFVALAAVFCATGLHTAVRLYARSTEAKGFRRAPWLALAGLAGGAGIWATHFTAMLAYLPSVDVGYDIGGTALSLLVVIATTTAAFVVNDRGRKGAQWLAGVLFGLGVASMHYIGMSAFHPEGQVFWNLGFVTTSVALGAALGACGMVVAARAHGWRGHAYGAGILVLATCGLHFTAMAAVTVVVDPNAPHLSSVLTRGEMATCVALLTALILGGAAGLLLVDVQGRRDSLARFRLLFDANPAPMWLFEVGTFRVLSVNDAAVREFGYSREQLLQMTVYDLFHPDEHAALRAIAARNAQPYDALRNWRAVRADGAEIVVEPHAQPIPYGDRTAYLTALFDVTAREQTNKALVKAKEAAEDAARVKGEFLANISHEIRTPLNGVMGIAAALERTSLSKPQREMVNVMQGSASTLQRLLDDLLDSSRMDRGELTIVERPFELRRAVAELAGLYSQAAEDKGVEFSLYLAGAPEGAVLADPERVRQVIGNLLSNAVKFTDSGSVELEVRALGDDRVRFVVTDTGIGFDADFHDRLFKRFEQADASVTRRFGGSGLGLSIAHDLAVRMGGTLTAASTRGEGSVFSLELPMPSAPCETKVSQPSATAGGAWPLRVLLADDHPVNRRLVQLMLDAADVQLVSVENGEQAVRMFEAESFDLVLMDMQMPVMDGLEATRRICAHQARTGGSTPIYMLSANVLPEHVEAALAAGATAHLSKPITLDALLSAVETVRAAMQCAA